MIDQTMNRQRLVPCHVLYAEGTLEQPRQKWFSRTKLATLCAVHHRVKGDQRIVSAGLEDIDSSSGAEHASTFFDEALRLFQVVDDVANQEMIEGSIGEGQLVN